MNYLRYKKLYQSENDGTFWPGYIELPDEDDSSHINTNQEEKSFYSSNPRIVTGILLLILVAAMFLNKTTAFILLIIVSLIATKEWFDMFEYEKIIPYPLLLYAALAPLLVVYFYGLNNFHVPYLIFPIGVIVYTGTFVNYGIYDKFGSSFLFLIWFGTGLASIGFLLNNFGSLFTFLLLISISINDVAAYEFGRRYGKRKLLKDISPNKTVEGFVAGLFAGTVVVFFILNYFLDITFTQKILISLLFIIFGTLGDLFESKIKRSIDLKDTSTLLPGHGGVLDRIDSQLISFPFLVLTIHFLDLIQ
tara:strand:+ start:3612 stop:4529 length:918 start_codon:yes stop_codon:yes gene_type:complete